MRSAKIVGIKKIGIIPTLDIEVDNENHVFYGNGIATSNSHGIGYGYLTYFSAYCKAHYPLEFYKTWLTHAENKIKPHVEVYYLVDSAKKDGVTIAPPSAKYGKNDFFIQNNEVKFGLRAIKSVGDQELDKLFKIFKEFSENFTEITWNQIIYRLTEVNKRCIGSLIESGSFDYFNVPRTKMLHEYTRIRELTKKEAQWLKENCSNKPLSEGLKLLQPTKKNGGGTANVNRARKVDEIIDTLENPGRSLNDTAAYIAECEERLMGVALSSSYLDDCVDACSADSTCKELSDGKNGKMTLSVELVEIKEHTITKEGNNEGRTMAFISAKDNTCEFGSFIIFPDSYDEYEDLLTEKNTVILFGEKDPRKDSFIINKVYQI